MNTTGIGDQTAPRVAGLNLYSGEYTVTWLDGNSRVVARKFDGDGDSLDQSENTQLMDPTVDEQPFPAHAAAAPLFDTEDGTVDGFLVARRAPDAISGQRLVLERRTAGGDVLGSVVAAQAGFIGPPSIAANGDGQAVVVYVEADAPGSSTGSVYARRMVSGSLQAGAVSVGLAQDPSNYAPRVAVFEGGPFAVVWTAMDFGGWGDEDVLIRCYDPDAIPVTSAAMLGGDFANPQTHADIATVSYNDGLTEEAGVVWIEGAGLPSAAVLYQRVDIGCQAILGADFVVIAGEGVTLTRPRIGGGNAAVIAWARNDSDGTHHVGGNVREASGASKFLFPTLNTITSHPVEVESVVAAPNGDYLIGWTHTGNGYVDGSGTASVYRWLDPAADELGVSPFLGSSVYANDQRHGTALGLDESTTLLLFDHESSNGQWILEGRFVSSP